MALYWPDQKVALDIVDDPQRRPFEGDESYTVLRVTCADLRNYDSYRKIERRLCELLGHEVSYGTCCMDDDAPDADSPYDKDLFGPDLLSNVKVIASSEDEAEAMRASARSRGSYVRGISVWEGPVPPGSFEFVSDSVRMSTPEYFFLRMANQLPFATAVAMGVELCGKYRTKLTQYDRGENYDYITEPRTTKAKLRHYLRGARGTKEGKRAKRILRLVSEECCSPMGCHLFLLLCLPKAQGGYGFERALLSGAFMRGSGFMPSSSGEYLAYDLCWPDKFVAVQYTGKQQPVDHQIRALNEGGMRTLCVTNGEIQDPTRFDRMAQKLAELLGTQVPEKTDAWLKARNRLRESAPMPDFPHMRLMMQEMREHMVA